MSFTHTWSGTQNYAHIGVALEGTDGTNVLVVDMLIVWDVSSITIDSNATSLGSSYVTAGNAPYGAVCTYQVVSSGGSGSVVGVDDGDAAWTAVQPGATPGAVTVNAAVSSTTWLGVQPDAVVVGGPQVVSVDVGATTWSGVQPTAVPGCGVRRCRLCYSHLHGCAGIDRHCIL